MTVEHEGTRTPVSLTSASWSDPHLQPASAHPESVERTIAALFFVGLLAFIGVGVAYWQNWAAWTLGATLGAGMVLVGAGLTAWGKYLMPRGPFVEERHVLASSPDEVAGFENALVERGATPVRRRKLLGGLLAGGLGVFGIVLALSLVRSLGPLPGNTLDTTNWKRGSYLVDRQGRRVVASELAVGSVVSSVFPEGFQDNEEAQAKDVVILIRVAEAPLQNKGPRATWDPAGFLAYSKMCTHAGCPVGLYERQLELLICPCHQSMFDVANNATPIFGPAPRPLPQLPLYIDSKGYLRSQSGFGQPVGPGFWERS